MRGQLADHVMYYWDKLAVGVQNILVRTLTAISFIMLICNVVYIIYYQYFCYCTSKVIAGSISLCVMLHLNKSL